MLDLVRWSRPDEPGAPEFIRKCAAWGASPRASQYLILGGKARAILQHRPHVTLEDIEALALPVLRHRIKPSFNAEAEGLTADDLIKKLLEA